MLAEAVLCPIRQLTLAGYCFLYATRYNYMLLLHLPCVCLVHDLLDIFISAESDLSVELDLGR